MGVVLEDRAKLVFLVGVDYMDSRVVVHRMDLRMVVVKRDMEAEFQKVHPQGKVMRRPVGPVQDERTCSW